MSDLKLRLQDSSVIMFKNPKPTQPNLKIVFEMVKIDLKSLKIVFVASFYSFQTN